MKDVKLPLGTKLLALAKSSSDSRRGVVLARSAAIQGSLEHEDKSFYVTWLVNFEIQSDVLACGNGNYFHVREYKSQAETIEKAWQNFIDRASQLAKSWGE